MRTAYAETMVADSPGMIAPPPRELLMGVFMRPLTIVGVLVLA